MTSPIDRNMALYKDAINKVSNQITEDLEQDEKILEESKRILQTTHSQEAAIVKNYVAKLKDILPSIEDYLSELQRKKQALETELKRNR